MKKSANVAQLMAELDSLGIILQPHGNALQFYPESALKQSIVERMKENKAELMAIGLVKRVRNGGNEDLALLLEESWGERIAICCEDGSVPQATAESIALDQLREMMEALEKRGRMD